MFNLEEGDKNGTEKLPAFFSMALECDDLRPACAVFAHIFHPVPFDLCGNSEEMQSARRGGGLLLKPRPWAAVHAVMGRIVFCAGRGAWRVLLCEPWAVRRRKDG